MKDTKKALLAEVLSLQAQIEGHKKTAQVVNEAIANCEMVLAAPEVPDNKLGPLQEAYSALLADKAIGNDKPEQIEALASDIAAESARVKAYQAENSKGRKDSEQTLTGLKKRLDEVTIAIDFAMDLHKEKVDELLLAEAELVGEEYLNLGKAITRAHSRLLALNRVLQGRTGAQRLLNNFTITSRLQIPIFNLTAHEGTAHHMYPGQLKEPFAAGTDEAKNKAATAEIEQLEKAGVALSMVD